MDELILRKAYDEYINEFNEKVFLDWKPYDAFRLRLKHMNKPKDMNKFVQDDWSNCDFCNHGVNNTLTYKESYATILYCLIRHLKPSIVVETGVQNGMSTELILGAMAKNGNGKLYSIDCGENNGDKSTHRTWDGEPGIHIRDFLKKRWELRIGDSKTELPKLINKFKECEEEVDIFIHDSDHSVDYMDFEINSIKDIIKNNGVLTMHDKSRRELAIDKDIMYTHFMFGADAHLKCDFWIKKMSTMIKKKKRGGIRGCHK